MQIARPVVFPLFGVSEGKCACGQENCGRAGKHPRVKWGALAYGDPVPTPDPGAGAGLKTGAHPLGSDCFVVDLDSPEAMSLFETLGPCPFTYVVETPRGFHLYFRHPGFPVSNSAGELGKGIDIRGDGGFVVAAGSPSRSGKAYAVAEDVPLADAPEWLLAWLRPRAKSAQKYTAGSVVCGEEKVRHLELYRNYLKSEAVPRGPEHRGKGDAILFEVVQRGVYDLSLPEEDVLESIREFYDPRCSPQWGDELEERVAHKAKSALESRRPPHIPLPPDLEFLTKPSTALAMPFSDEPAEPTEIEEIEKQLKITWGKWDTVLPPPVYTIEEIVPAATLGVIVAKGSSLKTWLVLSMLADVAAGKPWLGRPTRKGRTLLVDFESGRDIIQERVQYLGAADTEDMGIASFPVSRIDDPKFWIALTKLVKFYGVKLVGLDSFAAGAIGVDENDAKSADPLHFASRFIDETGCGILMIHHAKKGEGGDERDLVRGSGAIYGAADWVYTMIAEDEDRTKMKVRCIKAFRKKIEDFSVALTIDGLCASVSETVETGSRAAQKILDVLSAGPKLTLRDIERAAKVKSGSLKDEIVSLMRARRVAELPGVGFCVDSRTSREDRIRQAANIPGLATPGALASAAHVDVAEVHELLRDGKLYKSGSRYVYVDNKGAFT